MNTKLNSFIHLNEVMIDIQLDEMKITFEKNTNQNKNPNVEQKQEYSFTAVAFCSPCQRKKILACDPVIVFLC